MWRELRPSAPLPTAWGRAEPKSSWVLAFKNRGPSLAVAGVTSEAYGPRWAPRQGRSRPDPLTS